MRPRWAMSSGSGVREPAFTRIRSSRKDFMSGQAGGRGYLIQAVIAVLDAIHDGEWTECALEPQLGADKVDILLRSPAGDRVSQIKSSENAIGAADVHRWCEELESSYPNANQYELRLIGPVTGSVASTRRVGNVDIPLPHSLNIQALLEQCAHRLDRYLHEHHYGPTRPKAREILAQALATRFGQQSASAQTVLREEFSALLASWVTELLPTNSSPNADVPHQLPGSPADFVGRVNELALLEDAASRNNIRVIIIHGLTGVGKSALATHAAALMESSFPDGQIYLDLRRMESDDVSRTRVLVEAIHAFRPTYPASNDSARCLADFRSILAGRRVLIIAENAQSSEQVVGLVPPANGLLIVTTQSRFELAGAVTLELDVLPIEDGTVLAQSIAPRASDLAPQLAEICGGLPLAVRIACGTLNARPDLSVDQYVDRLIGIGERANLVRGALDVSCSYLPSAVRRSLAAAAVFFPDFTLDGLSAALDQTDDVTDSQLGVLIGRHLIEWDNTKGRYYLHDLVRAYIIDVSDGPVLSEFYTRHAQYYADVCSRIDELYRERGESVFLALRLFDSESANIAAGFSFCSAHASNETAAAEVCTEFVRGLTHVMDLRLNPITRAEILVAGLAAAKKLGHNGLVVLHSGNLGRVYRELGELELALRCQEWVLKVATKAGHRDDQAYAHHHIGLTLLKQKEFQRGVEHLERCLELTRDPQLAMKALESSTLNNLGSAYLTTQQPAKALNYFRSALDLAREFSDPRFLATTMVNLGSTLLKAGQELPLAVEMLEAAVGIAADLGDRQLQFFARAHLSDALAGVGRTDEARTVATLQYAEATAIGYTRFEVDALQAIGELQLANDDVAAAESSFDSIRQIAQDRNDQEAERKALASLAKAALQRGDRVSAITLLEQRLELTSDDAEKALSCWNLGVQLVVAGDRSRAIGLMRQAVKYFASIHHEGLSEMENALSRVENGVE